MPRRRGLALIADTRSVTAVEFAIVAPVFFLMLFFIFALAAALFQQEALDSAVHVAVRNIQTGNAQNQVNGTTFITQYVCPNVQGLLNCNNIYVKVQNISMSASQDYYNFTTGGLPVSNGSLDLSTFGSANFCNSAASTFLLVTAVYVGPGITPGFLPNPLSIAYNGAYVHATFSQVAAYTEAYPVQATTAKVAPSC